MYYILTGQYITRTQASFCPIEQGPKNLLIFFLVYRKISDFEDENRSVIASIDRACGLPDGTLFGEGAAVLAIEELEHARARGATILAEVTGYGTSNDAYHISAPAENGAGAVICMRLALEDAGLKPNEVDYINAHGTSTPLNDKSETAAIKSVFGDIAYQIPVSSTKSMTGHLLGASGAVEAAICVQIIQENILPATINLKTPDPECDLDYVPNSPRQVRPDHIVSNSFGFGGHNATLVISRYQE